MEDKLKVAKEFYKYICKQHPENTLIYTHAYNRGILRILKTSIR